MYLSHAKKVHYKFFFLFIKEEEYFVIRQQVSTPEVSIIS